MMNRRLALFLVVSSLLFLVSVAFAQEPPDVIKLKKDMQIDKDITVNDVIVIDGHATIIGRVEKNVIVVGGSAFLKDGSYVGGDVITVGGKVFKDPYAIVAGRITQIYVPVLIPALISILHGGWISIWLALGALIFLGLAGLALILIAIIPQHVNTVVGALEKSFLGMLAWGILGVMLIVPVAILLAISIVGIFLIPLEILIVALAMIMGCVSAAIFIGDRIFLSTRKATIPIFNAILGIVI
ncbi:MAG: hypothetical protein NC933_05860, partial [Candidatus Omnitrophica bacterium]|nr:hypothetical protein [Candidatus Omnitrophota bacterium]